MSDLDPTPEEAAAIRALNRLAAKWPKSLWLFSGSGTLYVLRKGASGEHVTTASGGTDPAMNVGRIDRRLDGGDW